MNAGAFSACAAAARVVWLDPTAEDWSASVDALRAGLGAPTNATLFPPHFTKSTFPRIGGQLARFEAADGDLLGGGWFFPRGHDTDQPAYTLRAHLRRPVDLTTIARRATEPGQHLAGARVVVYEPAGSVEFDATHIDTGDGVVLGRPTATEAVGVRELQRQIWSTEPDFLYPVDIHSTAFRAGTSLIARVDGQLAGFLFGFRTFGGFALPEGWRHRFDTERRLESQLMGVLADFRGRGLSVRLKRQQALDALVQGISVLTWTVDPLQWANAALNFGALRAVAAAFYPDYYAFRNELNRVSASRFGIVWLVDTQRARPALRGGARAEVLPLDDHPAIARLDFDADATTEPKRLDATRVAIETPADWTAVQRADPELAERWRRHTDAIFAAYLGCQLGDYLITGVATAGVKRYLIADRISTNLLAELAE